MPANPSQLTQNVAIVGDIMTYTPGQVQKVLNASVARTDTSAKTLGLLPAGATVIGVTIYAAAASNAGTTATLSLGFSGGTGTEIMNAQDVKTAASGQGQVTPNKGTLGVLSSSQKTVTGIYAETGTASNAGGPWQVVIEYLTV